MLKTGASLTGRIVTCALTGVDRLSVAPPSSTWKAMVAGTRKQMHLRVHTLNKFEGPQKCGDQAGFQLMVIQVTQPATSQPDHNRIIKVYLAIEYLIECIIGRLHITNKLYGLCRFM